MYGRHGTMTAKPGRRGALVALLLEAARGDPMPGCRLYVVSEVLSDPDTIAVTEVWDDRAAHAASLQLESVRALITEARPLIAALGQPVELHPVGGQGLD
ncbi:MAG: hypothetical protein QOH08_2541 [Chloroflexota bacterium]|nr:hypothetical protein [Chloroflexota bacterium]